MASGHIPGGGASRGKQRWNGSNSKNKSITGCNQRQSSKQAAAAAAAMNRNRSSPPLSFGGAASEDDSYSQKRESGISGYTKLDNMVKISFDSISRFEVRNLKRKLGFELEKVRKLVRRLEIIEAESVSKGYSKRGGHENSQLRAPAAAKDSVVCDNGNGGSINKKLKSGNGGKKDGGEFVPEKGLSPLFKSCSNLLGKLMKHKHGWVFNAPVDVKGLGLQDYYTVIKKPMDLGTVKSRLSKNWYKSPVEFAEDVRLTFSNAMLYNPKGQDVHHMAELLSKMFEEKWVAIEAQYNKLNKRREANREINLPRPPLRKTPAPPDQDQLPDRTPSPPAPPVVENRILERAESMTMPADPKTISPVPEKPNAIEPNKRDMTYEEKRRLSEDLQDMPSEELEGVVQIIKKRNPGLSQQDDEIEVDIDSVDNETLWELQRFVSDYKERLSNNKRRAEFSFQPDAESSDNIIQASSTVADARDTMNAGESAIGRSPKASLLSQRENQIQADNVSGSSSSGGSSSDSRSNSSDSNSGSSSGHGSDVGNSI